jgi:hypothetical protein
MTAARDLRELDGTPREPWRERSSAGIRRLALQACEEAVRRVKDSRKKPKEEAA